MREQARTSAEKGTLFAAVFSLLIFAHLVLLWRLRIYPFIDLPDHLAAATIVRFYGDPSNRFADYFSIHTLLQPNTFHLFFCGWKLFPSVEFANKVFYSLYVVLLPLATLAVVRKLRGDLWYSLFSFLVLYNSNVSWGFVGFMISIPVVLLLVSLLLDYDENCTASRKLALALVFVLLFFMHALTAVFALLLFFACRLRHGGNPLRLLRSESVPAVPLLLLMTLWWTSHAAAGERGMLPFLLDYYRGSYLPTLPERARLLIGDNRHLFAARTGSLISLCFAGCILAPTIWAFLRRREALRENLTRKGVRAVLIFGLAALACSLFLPDELPGEWGVYQRFPVFFFLAAILFASTLPPVRLPRLKEMGLCAACLLHLGLYLSYFQDFARDTRSFTRSVFPESPESGKLAGVVYDSTFRGRPIYWHFPSYYIVWQHGIANTAAMDYRFGTIPRKPAPDPLPSYFSLFWAGKVLDRRYANAEYLLTRGELPECVRRRMKGYRLDRRVATWSLYERQALADALSPANLLTIDDPERLKPAATKTPSRPAPTE